MVFQQCPVCQHVNDELALRCAACHSDLRDADTVPAALFTLPPLHTPSGALWLDDIAPQRAAAAASAEPPPEPPVLTLRDVVAPRLPRARAAPLARQQPPQRPPQRPQQEPQQEPPQLPPQPAGMLPPQPAGMLPPLPPIPTLQAFPPLPASAPPEPQDPLPTLTPRPAPPPARPLTPPLPTPLATELPSLPALPDLPARSSDWPAPVEDDPGHAARAAAREARRASVRRARLRQAAAALGDTVPEVLVLDRDGAARDLLCNLLRGFGFGVHPLADVRRAIDLRKTRHFVAAFVDIRLDAADGGLGIDLCHQWHEAGDSVLVLVTQPLNSVDRVRAEMLGFVGILAKPVSRGDVARVLDANGVALPSDARRL